MKKTSDTPASRRQPKASSKEMEVYIESGMSDALGGVSLPVLQPAHRNGVS